MTTDFAKSSRNNQNHGRKPKERNPKERHHSATRGNSNDSDKSPTKPFLAGSVFGVLLCLSVQWFMAQSGTSVPEEIIADRLNPETVTGPVFDFYTKLREVEVLVPDQSTEIEVKDIEYLLQAGSFRDAKDADSMRAQLILLNLTAEIRKFNHNGEIWHRVIVGPYDNRSTMSSVKTTLLENGIEALLLTQVAKE